MHSCRGKRRCAAALLLILIVMGCGPSVTELRPLRLVEQTRVETGEAEEVYSLRFEDEDGESVRAYLRQPVDARAGGGRYGIVLIAGRETGRQAAAIIPGPLEGLVLAVEYPEVLPTRLEAGAMVRRLPSIRRTALRMPGVLRGAGHHLAERPEVDARRVALVGVSFGMPFATPAGRDRVFGGVALLYGAADLELVFRTNLPIERDWLRGMAARFLAWYFRPLEPAGHVGAISPTPLLLINGLEDELIPRAAALRLREAAGPPVRQIWLPRAHLMPRDLELMRELADSTVRHFEFLR